MRKTFENGDILLDEKWADYPQGRIDLKNGICLCHRCHTEEHKFDNSYHLMKAY